MFFLSDREIEARRLLFPFAFEKTEQFFRMNKRFVHYCSARAASSILESERVWMRNSRLMNDFSEMEYGASCLQAALDSSQGDDFRRILQKSHLSLASLLNDLDNVLPSIKKETYILCLSEHETSEDQTGRLSMWRGYGGPLDSTALILRSEPFYGVTDLSPVAYLTEREFLQQFSVVVQNLPRVVSLLRYEMPKLNELLMTAITFAIMATKHPGFREEKEWRLVFRPGADRLGIMQKAIEQPHGFPETIYQAPLKNRPDLGISGIEVRDILDRIIIGPSDHAESLKNDFVALLATRGVADPESRVAISNIPFRHTISAPQ